MRDLVLVHLSMGRVGYVLGVEVTLVVDEYINNLHCYYINNYHVYINKFPVGSSCGSRLVEKGEVKQREMKKLSLKVSE